MTGKGLIGNMKSVYRRSVLVVAYALREFREVVQIGKAMVSRSSVVLPTLTGRLGRVVVLGVGLAQEVPRRGVEWCCYRE